LHDFERKIAPFLRMAHVDPATCIDDLDHADSMINSVSERYRYLHEKLLQAFVSLKSDRRFYFCTDGKTVEGPVTHDELRRMQVVGTLNENTQICEVGTTIWKKMGLVRLKHLL
jgi:GYF domain 2